MTNLLTQQQVQTRLQNAGARLRVSRVLAACAMVEGANPEHPGFSDFDLVGDVDLQTDVWGPSLSGFQIRSRWAQFGTGEIRDGRRLPNPRFAVRSALAIYRSQGFSAWSTFTSGQYKAFLPDLFPVAENVYVVMPGDTLGGIAIQFDTTYEELARLNGLSSPYTLSIGQHIKLS